jgi:hypothetical protein
LRICVTHALEFALKRLLKAEGQIVQAADRGSERVYPPPAKVVAAAVRLTHQAARATGQPRAAAFFFRQRKQTKYKSRSSTCRVSGLSHANENGPAEQQVLPDTANQSMYLSLTNWFVY